MRGLLLQIASRTEQLAVSAARTLIYNASLRPTFTNNIAQNNFFSKHP
jgi:hypothetical protein